MARYLVVAEGTLGGEALRDDIRERAERGPCELHVLVPASADAESPPTSEGVVAGGTTSSLPAADAGPTAPAGRSGRDVAFQRMKDAMARFEELGVDGVEGEVGDPDPEQAIADALASSGPFDEILLATPPAGASSWVGMDLASKVERHHDISVTHIEAPETPPTD